MELSQTSTDWGGLIYAYNDSNFKLWSPNDRKGYYIFWVLSIAV